jgi:orotidine-5'-phosphate decarboxylase
MKHQVAKVGQIMVALDFSSEKEALGMISKLETFRPYLKVGMQLFYLAGPSLIYKLKEKGFPIFLDLKLHDIPNTVKGASQSIASLGVDVFNVHCAGGKSMMEAALEGVEMGRTSHSHSPMVIGVTQLTSTSQEVLNREIGIPKQMNDAIVDYAELAKESGLHGVVCSPLEVGLVKHSCGQGFLTVTPGIRPSRSAMDDQVRVTTPREAVQLGTDYMVIGRAITSSSDPALAYQQIIEEIETV